MHRFLFRFNFEFKLDVGVRLIYWVLWGSFFFFLSGCQSIGIEHFPFLRTENNIEIQKEKEKQESVNKADRRLTAIESEVERELDGSRRQTVSEMYWNDIINEIDLWLKDNQDSIYFLRAQLLKGQILELQSQFRQSVEIYKNVLLSSLQYPEVQAKTHMLLARCYEQLGEDALVLVNLEDAEKKAEYLPQDQVLAEIPARRAMVYYRIDQKDLGANNLKKAEMGIESLRRLKESQNQTQWLSQIYYRLGHQSERVIYDGNLEAYLDTLGLRQIFSLRSLEEGIEPWATLAEKDIKSSYQFAWKEILYQSRPSMKCQGNHCAEKKSPLFEGAVNSRLIIQEQQIKFSDLILEKLTELESQQLPAQSQKNQKTNEIFEFVRDLKKEVRNFNVQLSVRNPLTSETMQPRGLPGNLQQNKE